MPTDELSQAFLGVFNSSKEILRNKQMHLYCNMLDLLGRTCKTTGLAEKQIGIENLAEFWLNDILPLVFSPDVAIQTSAISTFEQGLSLLDMEAVHNTMKWPALKAKLVDECPDKIHNLRENKNSYWYQVWCFIIRVLDKEILKGASTINSFLTVVELGFRSPDHQIRAEAFLCWRLLIKIFSEHNELTMSKRLKLICIPLKSSQSKTPQAASVKLRVWWYFLTCLGPQMTMHFENAVEPFLIYLFGGEGKATSGVAQQYEEARPIALPCMASLLLRSRDEYLERVMREHKMEVLGLPSPLILVAVLEKHWKTVLDACLAAIRLLTAEGGDATNYEHERRLTQILVTRTLRVVQELDLAECTEYFVRELLGFLPNSKTPLNMVMNAIATEGLLMSRSLKDAENFESTAKAMFSLFAAARSIVAPSILHRSLDQLKNSCLQFEGSAQRWQANQAVMRLVLEDDSNACEMRLLLWLRASDGLLQHSQENSLNYRLKENAAFLDRWIMWPLRCLVDGSMATISNQNRFFNLWQQLLLLGQNSPDRLKQLNDINDSLKDLFRQGDGDRDVFYKLFEAHVEAVCQFIKGSVVGVQILLENTLALFKVALEMPNLNKSSFEQHLKLLLSIWSAFKPAELNADVAQQMMPVLKIVARIALRDQHQQKKFFEEWKRNMLDRLKGPQQKTLLPQIRDALRGGDDFVIIPTVWSLDPEKLTERQKERFSEKADIPALYNDMSQSQDSSIKPWTPKKVVIAKKNQTEIVIGSSEKERPPKQKDIVIDICSSATDSDTPDILTQHAQRQSPSEVTSSSSSENGEKPRILRSGKSVLGPTSSASNAAQAEGDKDAGGASSSSIIAPSEDNVIRRTRNSLRGKLFDDLTNGKESYAPPFESKETISSDAKSPPKNKSITSKRTPRKCTETTESVAATDMDNTEIVDLISETPDCLVLSLVPETEEQLPTNKSDNELELRDVNVTGSTMDPMEAPAQICDLINAKETSPKKATTNRLGLLSSPPDRRSTNNSTSPSLRPKPVTFTGRGAQLINMIRNKRTKLEHTSSPSVGVFNRREVASTLNDSISENPAHSNNQNHSCSTADQHAASLTSTPVQGGRDFLTFSKRLPSPSASPSASILKRKLRRESIEESTDTPVSKRKRVSFHDPPVSVTKEYERDCDETKSKQPKRCLALDKIALGPNSETRHTLKRRSRLDSMNEIEKFRIIEPAEKSLPNAFAEPTRHCSFKELASSDTEKSPVAFYGHQEQHGEQPTASEEVEPPAAEREELSLDKALEMVAQQCSFDVILEKYLNSKGQFESAALKPSASNLAKAISKCMAADPKVKTTVLETLSENHAKDFLDHAIQENLATVVCDRLNLTNVIGYICAKAHINASCRLNLLAQIPDILKHSKSNSIERIHFIKSIMQSLDLNNDNILDLIKILIDIRTERETLAAGSGTRQDSESTSDVSSSNL